MVTLSRDDLIELLAIDIVNGYDEDESIEPPPYRSVLEIAMAQDEMEKCSFDSEEEMWEKARELAEGIFNKYNK